MDLSRHQRLEKSLCPGSELALGEVIGNGYANCAWVRTACDCWHECEADRWKGRI